MATTPHFMMIHPPAAVNDATILHASTGAQPTSPTTPTVAPPQPIENRLIFRNPLLGGMLFPIMLPRPRSAFSLPTLISPTATPTDQTLFDEPQSGGPQHYLPQYALDTTGSGAQAQLNVSLAGSGSGWLLTVKLKDVTPMSEVSNCKAEMPTTRYFVQATLPNIMETWDFPNAVADSTSITLTMPIADIGTLADIHTAMTTQSLLPKLILRRSPALALPVPLAAATPGQPPPQQLYRQSAVAIDTSIDFYFDPTIDQNIFSNLPQGGSGTSSTLNPATAPYPSGGVKSYPYWQDPMQPGQIYFLPDAYKIARMATSPHTPAMSVTTSGSDPATLNVTLTFLALPVWDPNRIAAAAVSLSKASNFSVLPATTFSILPATTTQLLLNLPSTGASASDAPVPVANATIDTANGIQGSVTLSLALFTQVYQAIFQPLDMLLTGQVNVTVDQNTEPVPFSGRASDFTGEIIDTTLNYDHSANQVTVVATNGIESPIQVNALPVALATSGTATPLTVVSTSPTLPATVVSALQGNSAASASTASASTDGSSAGTPASGAAVAAPPSSVTLVLQLAAGQSVGSSSNIQFDLSQVTVNPDSQAIWQAIVQNQALAPVQRQITLQLVAEVFASQTASVASASSSASSGSSAAAGSSTSAGTDTSDAGSATPASSSAASSSSSAPNQPAGAAANPLLAVQVVFQNGQSVTFTPSMTANGGIYTQTIGLNVDIEDYIFGGGDSSNYTYRVDTITAAGVQQGSWQTTNNDAPFVTLGS